MHYESYGPHDARGIHEALTHASPLAAHLVYGATAEGVRRAVRSIM
jgi:hypothetical protein